MDLEPRFDIGGPSEVGSEAVPDAFVREWEAAWNAHDLDRILALYSDDVTFCSRKAVPFTGDGEVRGKSDLRRYWSQALRNQPDLRFTVQSVFVGYRTLVITYLNIDRSWRRKRWFLTAPDWLSLGLPVTLSDPDMGRIGQHPLVTKALSH